MGQGEVVVPGSGDVPVLHQGEVQVSVEALLQLRHILHSHDAPDADLLPLLLVCERGGHAEAGVCVLGAAGVCWEALQSEVQREGNMVEGF